MHKHHNALNTIALYTTMLKKEVVNSLYDIIPELAVQMKILFKYSQ